MGEWVGWLLGGVPPAILQGADSGMNYGPGTMITTWKFRTWSCRLCLQVSVGQENLNVPAELLDINVRDPREAGNGR